MTDKMIETICTSPVKTVIGFRVSPKKIYYTIMERTGSEIEIKSVSSVTIPLTLDVPSQLSYIRNTFRTLIHQYSIIGAGIKVSEIRPRANVTKSDLFRYNIEGVIMELFTDSIIEKHYTLASMQVSSLLALPHKKVVEHYEELKFKPNQKTDSSKVLGTEHKESCVIAFAVAKECLL